MYRLTYLHSCSSFSARLTAAVGTAVGYHFCSDAFVLFHCLWYNVKAGFPILILILQHSKTCILHRNYQQVDVVQPIEAELRQNRFYSARNTSATCKYKLQIIQNNWLRHSDIQSGHLLDVLVDIQSGHLPWCPGRWRDDICCSHQTVRCFYQLRQLRTVHRTLTVVVARTLIHAFIINRVDCCVFGSTSAVHLRPLQSVLNAAARLVVRKQKFPYETSCTGYRF